MIRKKITLHGFPSTPDIESWVDKIPAALAKHVADGESALVDIQIKKLARHASGMHYFVEANFYGNKTAIHAQAENENLPSAIEAVRDELVSEFVSRKKKEEHFIRRGGRAIKNFVKGFYGKKNR